MEKLIFSPEEKKKIEDAMQLVIKDMLKLWDTVSDVTDKLDVDIYRCLEGTGYSLPQIVMSADGIKLTQYLSPEKDLWLYKNQPVKAESKKKFGFLNRKDNRKSDDDVINYCLYYTFVKAYKHSSKKYRMSIRDLIVEKISEVCTSKEDTMGKVNDILKDYDKSASVEVCFNSQNQQKIEVSSENGRCVGIINFNGNVIKIVTNGDINLVDRPSSVIKKK